MPKLGTGVKSRHRVPTIYGWRGGLNLVGLSRFWPQEGSGGSCRPAGREDTPARFGRYPGDIVHSCSPWRGHYLAISRSRGLLLRVVIKKQHCCCARMVPTWQTTHQWRTGKFSLACSPLNRLFFYSLLSLFYCSARVLDRQTLVAFLNPLQQSLHREDDSVMGVMSGLMRTLRR